MKSVNSALNDVSAIVFDLDNTLHEDMLTVEVAKSYFRMAKISGKSVSFFKNFALAISTNIGNKWGLKATFDALARSDATKEQVFGIANAHISGTAIEQTHDLLRTALAMKKDVFLTTGASDIGPHIYSRKYKIRDWIANPVKYSNGKVAGCEIQVHKNNITTAIEDMLDKHGFKLNECAIVADDKYYLPAMKIAKLAIASPNAGKEVKSFAHFSI